MPLPLVFAAPFAAGAVGTIGSWISATFGAIGLASIFSAFWTPARQEQVFDLIFEGAGGLIRDRLYIDTGLQLDADNPLTVASFSNAISIKTGILLTDISDADTTKSDIGKYVTDRLNSQLGLDLENVVDLDPTELKAQFEGQIIVSLQQALVAGYSPMLSAPTLDMIVDMCAAARGLTPAEEPPEGYDEELDARRLKNRLAQRKYYAAQKAAGLRRVYVDVDDE